jgi:hypothetical protein
MVSNYEQSDNNFEYYKVSLTKESGRFSNEENANECPNTVNFDLDRSTKKSEPIIVEDKEDIQPMNLAAEMLRFHHKFGHIYFAKL